MFVNDCQKNLNNLTPFSQLEYVFAGNGTSGDFILDNEIPDGAKIYISVNDVSNGYSYIYTSSTKTVSISPIPKNLDDVYIAWYIIGEFTDTLTYQEIDILTSGMLVPWLQEQLYKDKLLQQSILTNDYKRSSQAEHIRSLQSLMNNQLNITKSKINEYSYKQNNLLGLGGDLI